MTLEKIFIKLSCKDCSVAANCRSSMSSVPPRQLANVPHTHLTMTLTSDIFLFNLSTLKWDAIIIYLLTDYIRNALLNKLFMSAFFRVQWEKTCLNVCHQHCNRIITGYNGALFETSIVTAISSDILLAKLRLMFVLLS